jgi:hypothetical protein
MARKSGASAADWRFLLRRDDVAWSARAQREVLTRLRINPELALGRCSRIQTRLDAIGSWPRLDRSAPEDDGCSAKRGPDRKRHRAVAARSVDVLRYFLLSYNRRTAGLVGTAAQGYRHYDECCALQQAT